MLIRQKLYPSIGCAPNIIPTTIFITIVNTFIQIPITAIGISAPYFDIAPYFESIILHTKEIITIDICVIKVEIPSFITFPNNPQLTLKLLNLSLNVFVLVLLFPI